MSLVLVKVIDFLVEPLGFGLVVVLLGLALSTRFRRPGLGVVGIGVIWLWLLATPWMGDTLLRSLESRFPPTSPNAVPSADAIVVLGGGIAPATAPRLYPDLNEAGDRLWYGARLFRAGTASKLIVSGGRPPGRSAPASPAMQKMLVDWQVPMDAIIMEAESRTTYGNARHTAALCRTQEIDEIVLVTSAAHMRRALATFRSTAPQLQIHPAPTDYRAVQEPFTPADVVPDADGIMQSTAATHEYVGYLYYKLRGWID